MAAPTPRFSTRRRRRLGASEAEAGSGAAQRELAKPGTKLQARRCSSKGEACSVGTVGDQRPLGLRAAEAAAIQFDGDPNGLLLQQRQRGSIHLTTYVHVSIHPSIPPSLHTNHPSFLYMHGAPPEPCQAARAALCLTSPAGRGCYGYRFHSQRAQEPSGASREPGEGLGIGQTNSMYVGISTSISGGIRN